MTPDTDDPCAIVSRLMEATAPGRYLVIVHPSSDIRPEASAQMAANLNQLVAQKRTHRSQGEVSRFFGGLDLVQPGVVPLPQWRPDTADEAAAPTLAWSAWPARASKSANSSHRRTAVCSGHEARTA
jgi:hypothetical protein